jgi:hypothetical protein
MPVLVFIPGVQLTHGTYFSATKDEDKPHPYDAISSKVRFGREYYAVWWWGCGVNACLFIERKATVFGAISWHLCCIALAYLQWCGLVGALLLFA